MKHFALITLAALALSGCAWFTAQEKKFAPTVPLSGSIGNVSVSYDPKTGTDIHVPPPAVVATPAPLPAEQVVDLGTGKPLASANPLSVKTSKQLAK